MQGGVLDYLQQGAFCKATPWEQITTLHCLVEANDAVSSKASSRANTTLILGLRRRVMSLHHHSSTVRVSTGEDTHENFLRSHTALGYKIRQRIRAGLLIAQKVYGVLYWTAITAEIDMEGLLSP